MHQLSARCLAWAVAHVTADLPRQVLDGCTDAELLADLIRAHRGIPRTAGDPPRQLALL